MPATKKRKSEQAPAESEDGTQASEEREDSPLEENEQEAEQRTQPKKPAAKRAKKAAEDIADIKLLDVCKEHGSSVDAAAKEWVARYKEGHTAAIAELLSFLVQTAGSTYEVTDEEVEEGEIDKLVSRVKKEIDREGYVDLLKGKGHKQYRTAFLRLWDALIQCCYEQEVLLDDGLLETVCHLLIGLSSSEMRCFRYVGTLTACHVATSLVRVMLTLSEERETARCQDAAEARKKGGKAAQDRARAFKRTAERCHSQINELQAHVNSLFQGVTTNRVRDTCEEIRAVVVDGVGNWTLLYPAVYLRDLYLKYLGWALSDKESVVREAAVEALLGLYSEPSNLAPLHEFTERFKSRYCELPNDISDPVAVQGVKLVTLLVKAEELLQSQVMDAYLLLMEESVSLRHAAAELVAELIEEIGRQYLRQLQEGQKGRRKSLDSYAEEELQLAGLLQIIGLLRSQLSGGGKHEHDLNARLVYQVVDALFDRVGVLQDWKALTQALLDDKACERRGEAATTDVALILQWAVHKACGGAPGLSASPQKRQAAKNRAAAAAQDHRQEVTMALSKVLLRLLRKHQTDPAKAGALASTLRHLKLEVFSLKRDEQGLQEILTAVASLLTKHVAPSTVSQCLQALVHCANPSGTGPQEPGASVFRDAVIGLVDKLAVAAQDLLSLSDDDLADEAAAPAAEEAEETFACRTALLRVHHLLLLSPAACDDDRLPDSLDKLLQAAVDGRQVPAEVLNLAVKGRALVLLWQLQQQHEDEDLEIEGWPQSVARFFNVLQGLLPQEPLKATVATAMADLYLVFRAEPLQALNRDLTEAAVKASASQAESLWESVEEVLARQPPASEDAPSGDEDPGHQDLASQGGQLSEESRMKAGVFAAIGRLVICQVQPFSDLLPGKLLSHLEAADDEVAAAAKEVAQHLKKAYPSRMPKLYLEALQAAFARHGGQVSEEVLELARRAASSYSGFVPHASGSVAEIVRGAVRYAFRAGGVPETVAFLAAVQPLAARVAAKDCGALVMQLEGVAQGHAPDRNQPPWEPYFDLLTSLRERRDRLPRSALKRTGAAAKDRQPGRRISFKEAGKQRKGPGRTPKRPADQNEEAEDLSGPWSPGQRHAAEEEDPIEDSDEDASQPPPRFHSKTRRGSQLATAPPAPPQPRTPHSNGGSLAEEGRGQASAGAFAHDGVESSGPEMDEGMDAQEDVGEDMADDGADDGDAEVAAVGDVRGSSKVLPFTAEQLPSGLFMAGADSSVGGSSVNADSELEDEDMEEEMPARVRPRRA